MSSEPTGHPEPQWGSLPAERYLIQNWSTTTGEDATEQYRRLIRTFLQSGDLVSETELKHSDKPEEHLALNQDQIDSILKPWRSTKLRKIAGAMHSIQDDEVIILRTHYSGDPEEEEMFRTIVHENEEDDPSSDPEIYWWQILDDAALFNFGDAWKDVLYVLPELTARGKGKTPYMSTRELARWVAQYEVWNRDDLEDCVQGWISSQAYGFAIVDAEALSTSEVKFILPDINGNVVRSVRAPMNFPAMYRMCRWRGNFSDFGEWEPAEVGKKYRSNGSIGKDLYQKVKEARALIDPSELQAE